MFVYILSFLRRNQLCLPIDFQEHDRLLLEAEFFQIAPLIDILRDIKQKQDTVVLCMITHGIRSGVEKKVCIAHFQSNSSFQTNYYPTDYAVCKSILQSQGYSILNRSEKIESTGEWMLSMLSQGFLTNPVTMYEKNILGRFDFYEIWSK